LKQNNEQKTHRQKKNCIREEAQKKREQLWEEADKSCQLIEDVIRAHEESQKANVDLGHVVNDHSFRREQVWIHLVNVQIDLQPFTKAIMDKPIPPHYRSQKSLLFLESEIRKLISRPFVRKY